MPKWAGKWKGGRFYLDERGLPVYFIESNRKGIPHSIRLPTQDERLAESQLIAFRQEPAAFVRSLTPAEPETPPDAVTITEERIRLYMDSIHGCARDHRAARRSDLAAWGNYSDANGQPLDLRTADKKTLRLALASFAPDGKDRRRTGGFKRRAETLNAFCNWLVSEGELQHWSPLSITPSQAPAQRRAERVAYEPSEVIARWRQIPDEAIRDVLHIRAATGMHGTEIAQLQGARHMTGPLPEAHPRVGPGFIRTKLDREHEIKGVLQIRQKTKPRHRVSVDGATLAAAVRLSELKRKGKPWIPSRFDVYNACREVGIVPSNLRHTFTTLRGMARIVHYEEGGVSLDQVAEILGHRVGSKMTGSRYDKLQVPPMMKVPLQWDVA
jgi:integrase